MPIETRLLEKQPEAIQKCPKCGAEPFLSMLRGQVHRAATEAPVAKVLAIVRQQPFAYCAVICAACTDIVGWESPSASD